MTYFRLRKRTEYAIAMMSLLADAKVGEVVSVQVMMQKDIPRSYLVKIAKDLLKAKLIAAKEGRGGGYILAKDANKLTLLEIVEAVESKIVAKYPNQKLFASISNEIEDILSRYKLR